MTQIDGGQVLVHVMREFGVTTAFTLHGGHLDSAYRAAQAAGIRLVDTRHEQAAGIAATAWARTTGDVGVAMVTAGGGVSNVVTAVANAYADCVPSVFLGGAPPLHDVGTLPVNSGYDQLSVMSGITKWSDRVTTIERLADTVARAFQIAREGRPGPVYLDLPSDILFATIDDSVLGRRFASPRVTPPAPDPAAVGRALELLRTAERPVVLFGGGVQSPGASAALRDFAELTGIPVTTNNKSRGALPTNHPLWARGFSTLAAAASRGAGQADVVLIVGARLGLYTGGLRTSVIPESATVIQIDIQAEEIGRLRHVELGIAADSTLALRALTKAGTDLTWPDHREWVAALTARPGPAGSAPAASAGIEPSDLARAVAAAVPEDAIVVTDGGETPAWLDAVADSTEPHRWLGHGYLGVMGEGMPLAVGAQVAHPDRRVVCFAGDGAIGFNFAEFDTMARHGLPIVVVVNNDQQWSMSAHGQDLLYGPGNRIVSDLAATRYDLAAAGFGAHPEFVTRFDEIGPAIERALASGRPACVNVQTRPTQVAPVTRRMIGLAAEGLTGPDGKARVPYADILEV